MAECTDYPKFVEESLLPFLNGEFQQLWLDNIDRIPESPDKEYFESILHFMLKREDDVNLTHERIINGEFSVRNWGYADFGSRHNIIVRSHSRPEINSSAFIVFSEDCRTEALLKAVEDYVKKDNIKKPMMIIFGDDEDDGQSDAILQEFKKTLHETFDCADTERKPDNFYAYLPDNVTDTTELIIVHRYNGQFAPPDALSYAVDLVQYFKKHVIFLANGYERIKNKNVSYGNFDILVAK